MLWSKHVLFQELYPIGWPATSDQKALVDVDVQLAAKDRTLPDKLEHLLDLIREDNAYFKRSLSESER